jgi:hypothetical protein
VLHPRACGIDVGNGAHHVAVRPDQDIKPVRRFECFTADLHQKLIPLRRSHGGWAQTSDLAPDAYGTAATLYTMYEMDIPAGDPAYRCGVEYLLRTPLPDGS